MYRAVIGASEMIDSAWYYTRCPGRGAGGDLCAIPNLRRPCTPATGSSRASVTRLQDLRRKIEIAAPIAAAAAPQN